jgi:hypothetical protein
MSMCLVIQCCQPHSVSQAYIEQAMATLVYVYVCTDASLVLLMG